MSLKYADVWVLLNTGAACKQDVDLKDFLAVDNSTIWIEDLEEESIRTICRFDSKDNIQGLILSLFSVWPVCIFREIINGDI